LVVRVILRRCLESKSELGEIARWAWHEIDHQFALTAANSKTADFFQLAYAIILVASLVPQDILSPDHNLILQTALRLLFDNLKDGSWPRSQPLFHYPEAGSAYCYEYEMLTQLLSQPTLKERLLEYLPNLAVLPTFLESSAFRLPDGGSGWSSGHHSQFNGPESWSTASVFHFVHALDRLVAEAIRRSIFDYLRVIPVFTAPARRSDSEFAPDFLDCALVTEGEVRSLKQILLERFLQPLEAELDEVARGRQFSRGTPTAAILFGPPGTSKTELAGQVARFLGWELVTIDPSHFVSRGLDRIPAEADQIFGMLAAAERLVVLMDEFDEMVRERGQATELLSRFLTTSMLPKLARIQKRKRLVFLVATNHIDQFDVAINRPGRFDMIVQVMPPRAAAKLEWDRRRHEGDGQVGRALEDRFAGESKPLTERQQLMDQIEDFTFDEFVKLSELIDGCNDVTEVIEVIEAQHRGCTLMRIYGGARGEEKTWKAASDEQRSRINLPAGRSEQRDRQ
jgi:hypothetical protein